MSTQDSPPSDKPVKEVLERQDVWPPQHPRENISVVRWVFVNFLAAQILVNVDSGAIPAVLDLLIKEFGLGETLLGVLGSIPYLGLIVASPFVSRFLQNVSQKKLLTITIFFNIVGVAGLAASFTVYILYGSRVIIGLTQAALIIYLPVWVDEFAPERRLTLWMALVQACSIFGVTLGYFMTGFLRPWRWAIVIQGICLTIVWLIFFIIPKKYTDLYIPIAVSEEKTEISLDVEANVNSPGPRQCKSEMAYPVVKAPQLLGRLPGISEHPTKLQNETTVVPKVLSPGSSTTGSPPAVEEASATLREPTIADPGSEPLRIQPRTLSTDLLFTWNDHAKRLAWMGYDPSRVPGLPESGRSIEGADLYDPRTALVRRAHTLMVPAPAGSIFHTWKMAASSNDMLVLRPLHEQGKTPHDQDGFSLWQSICRLLKSSVYIWTLFTLCALIFVIMGTQYWSTEYFVTGKGADITQVRVLIAITSATAPTVGVFVGSFFIDCIGGYRSTEGVFRALWYCVAAALIACVSGIIASFLDTVAAIICIWIVLCFAGSVLPPALGMLIASVQPSMRPFASAFSMFVYNALGYALGIFLPGPFMAAFGMVIGMKVVFFWGILGVVGAIVALLYARRYRIIVHHFSQPKIKPRGTKPLVNDEGRSPPAASLSET